jgi:hypothetical protein
LARDPVTTAVAGAGSASTTGTAEAVPDCRGGAARGVEAEHGDAWPAGSASAIAAAPSGAAEATVPS